MSWRVVRLSSVADLVRTGVDPSSVPAGTRYVGLEHILSDGSFSDVASIDASELSSTKFAFTGRHVLFGKLRPYLRKVARPTFAGICSTDIIPIAPSEDLDRGYLFHFLRTDHVIARAASMSSGANLPRISPRLLMEFEIPLPPLAEQRRIAAILDQAEALRRKRRQTLKSLGRLERAILIQMFGVPDENLRGLPIVQFGSLIAEGPTNGLYKPAHDYGEGTPILRISDFYDGRVVPLGELRRLKTTEKEIAAYGLREGDIVINRVNSREYLGKSALIPHLDEDTVFESNMMKIGLNSALVDGTYCISFLQLPFVKRQVLQRTKDAINQSSINQSDVRSLLIMLPPIREQQKFALKVKDIEATLVNQSRHLAKLDALFAALQHRAFHGEL